MNVSWSLGGVVKSVAVLLPLWLAGCAAVVPAPVVDRPTSRSVPAQNASAPASQKAAAGFHSVKKGETLQSIALEYGQDYKELVSWNQLDNPNMIRVGQSLRVAPPDGAVAKPVVLNAPTEVKPSELPAAVAPELNKASANTDIIRTGPLGGKQPYSEQAWAALNRGDDKGMGNARADAKPEIKNEPRPEQKPDSRDESKTATKDSSSDAVDWAWPAAGKVITAFAEGASKGVGIAGKVGDAVLAAGSGKVLYAGEDLRGYGKLVVLKHNGNFLSVYAHNNQILVKEGQMVSKGEKIAELGKSDSDQPKLHFEIRRQGKPVDPAKFLPAR